LFSRNCIIHTTDIAFANREQKKLSVEVPLVRFPPRFVSVFLDDVLWGLTVSGCFGESDDRTYTVTRDKSLKVPFRDGLGVPLHSPRRQPS
jgi:hypothetical protein